MKYVIMVLGLALSAAMSTNALAANGAAKGDAGFNHSLQTRSEQGVTHERATEHRQQGMSHQEMNMGHNTMQSKGTDDQDKDQDKDDSGQGS
jgi:hypothetical protein